jgi:hypothetical protein
MHVTVYTYTSHFILLQYGFCTSGAGEEEEILEHSLDILEIQLLV